MDDSNEWELSKENVQPLRQGRKVASLTSALQHTPADLQQIKEQREYGDLFLNLRLIYSVNPALSLSLTLLLFLSAAQTVMMCECHSVTLTLIALLVLQLNCAAQSLE